MKDDLSRRLATDFTRRNAVKGIAAEGPVPEAPRAHAGLVPYDVVAELWSDGAKKRRWTGVSGASPVTGPSSAKDNPVAPSNMLAAGSPSRAAPSASASSWVPAVGWPPPARP